MEYIIYVFQRVALNKESQPFLSLASVVFKTNHTQKHACAGKKMRSIIWCYNLQQCVLRILNYSALVKFRKTARLQHGVTA